MLDSGTILQDRYRIVALLGQGGMGAVYRAWDLRLKVPVALKEMVPQPGAAPALLSELREQFEQEAAVLARMSHPGLVRVTDFFEESGNAYLVMDFVEGKSLADLIARSGAQPEPSVLAWGQQLLDALGYCHSKGVVHRDVKPQNIIIQSEGRVVLVDFGLVKLWDPEDPHTKTVMRGMGTPEYAPPEQYSASGMHTDPASDLYSLGATLYHALSGQAPPTATDRMATPEGFVPLRELAPAVSPQIEFVVMKALALARSERWRNAAEMTQALQDVETSKYPRATTPMPSESSVPVVPDSPVTAPPATEGTTSVAAPQERAPTPLSQPSYFESPPQESTSQKASKSGCSKWAWILGIAGGVVLLGAICVGAFMLLFASDGIFDDGLVSTPTVMPPPAYADDTPTPVSPSAEGFILTIDNRSVYDICYVLISPTESEDWGEDWLAAEEILASGSTRSFEVLAGSHDVLLKDCDNVTLQTAWEIAADTTIVVGSASDVGLRVVNDLDVEICYVYVSPSALETWGEDQLGQAESIMAGGSRIFLLSPGTYDFLARDCDGNDLATEIEVSVREETTWTISP